MMIRRGDIYIVDLSKIFPEGKHYQRGRRPCVIVSNNMANKYCELVNIIPLTSKNKHLPHHVLIHSSCLAYEVSWLIPECATAIDKKYLEYKVGYLTGKEMDNVDRAIKIQNGIRGYDGYRTRGNKNNSLQTMRKKAEK